MMRHRAPTSINETLGADDDVPTPVLAGGELLLAAVLVLVASVLVAADLAGALLAKSSLVGLSTAGRILAEATLSHRARSIPWPANGRQVGPRALLAWSGGLLVFPLVATGVLLAFRHTTHRHDQSGFVSRSELKRVASLAAAQGAAPVTRPSLSKRHLSRDDVGYPLGTSLVPHGIPLVASWEHSLELVAPPGTGKTLRVLAPILRQHPGPALATSTKPDLYEVSLAARRAHGPVAVLDPERLCPAADPIRWSPVEGCRDARVAERRAIALVAAAGDGMDMRSSGFFRRSAAAVLASYLHAAALDGLKMRDVCSWAARPQDRAPLRILSSTGEQTVDWGARLFAHTSGAEETTSGVMRTVDLALGCFADPDVLAQCSPSDAESFDFKGFLSTNGTVFALGKDRGSGGGIGPLITAFCDELVVVAEACASAFPMRRLDPPLLACLDEAPSIVPLPGLPGLIADGRGRGIVVVLAMQSFSQAEARWGKEGAATIRNAASILAVFGGLSVANDLDELSRLAGSRRIARSSRSTDAQGRTSRSEHTVEEHVLSSGAVHALRDGVALIFWGHLPPLLARLPGTWEGPDAQRIAIEEAVVRRENDSARHKRYREEQPS
jgi:type IV secretion system protein VirD4